MEQGFVSCSFLGLTDEVADYLTGLDKLHRQHRTNKDWILNYFHERFQTLPEQFSLGDGFKHLGFTDSRASFLADCLTQSTLSDHQTILYWASIYIQQYFDHHILFSGRPYLPRKEQDEAFLIRTIPDPEAKDEAPIDIKCLQIKLDVDDIRKFQGNKWITTYLAQDCSSMDESEFWYHGTKDVDATNIAENGIMLSKGKPFGQDFFCGNSFYVTNDFHFAYEWGKGFRRNWSNPAIVVFKIKDKTILSERSCRTFDRDSKVWKESISYFRNNQNHLDAKISRSQGRHLKTFEYFFGPCSMDGSKVDRADWKPTARMKNYEAWRDGRDPAPKYVYQLCLKEDMLADDFYNKGLNIHQILFF